jgi:hypothetical protein
MVNRSHFDDFEPFYEFGEVSFASEAYLILRVDDG